MGKSPDPTDFTGKKEDDQKIGRRDLLKTAAFTGLGSSIVGSALYGYNNESEQESEDPESVLPQSESSSIEEDTVDHDLESVFEDLNNIYNNSDAVIGIRENGDFVSWNSVDGSLDEQDPVSLFDSERFGDYEEHPIEQFYPLIHQGQEEQIDGDIYRRLYGEVETNRQYKEVTLHELKDGLTEFGSEKLFSDYFFNDSYEGDPQLREEWRQIFQDGIEAVEHYQDKFV